MCSTFSCCSCVGSKIITILKGVRLLGRTNRSTSSCAPEVSEARRVKQWGKIVNMNSNPGRGVIFLHPGAVFIDFWYRQEAINHLVTLRPNYVII
ncbi:hypothetical protein RRG08_000827 [Elysia crispata]|uniref:Uncharacterized protein n=1 Tax=Elysia crispata TaxID=231223 RepID=A0AAE0XM45_9GAST|nr:hypothetical protein RRG08_000827 [Elysia crispata]